MTNGINKSGFKRGQTPWNKKYLPAKEIIKMYKSGDSENFISKHFDSARGTIRRILKENNIPIRNQSASEKLKWSQMDSVTRSNQVRACHAVTKGRQIPTEERILRANSLEKSRGRIGIGENILANIFRKNNISFIQQAAIHTYNIDFLIGTIAVELNIGTVYPDRRKTDSKKIMHFLNRNRSIIYLLCKDISLIKGKPVKDLIGIINELSRNPPSKSKYWVIRCRLDSKRSSVDSYDLADVMTVIRPDWNSNS
jgi:hypothetical protein